MWHRIWMIAMIAMLIIYWCFVEIRLSGYFWLQNFGKVVGTNELYCLCLSVCEWVVSILLGGGAAFIKFITARKRSLQRLCFYRCLSVHRGGGCAWLPGGMHGCWWGDMHGCRGGVCVAKGGGMCGKGGHVWQRGGLCMANGGHAWDTTTYGDTINERAVRILLECILVWTFCIHEQWGR